ncbi:MAG TPA: hypothetical protein DCE55_22430 [Planctomycetaceae bacterium]|nr:hypothetical protein [Planctomycetaceae bacterium]|tara:strand:- start:21254 stop:21889 length:636 start_codon:yes stop_codon:yes gene_type:complete
MSRYFALAVVMLAFALPLVAADDIVVADFEGESYGKWQSSGEAFGTKPAAGTLQMQLPVSGFRGAGLVNSYRGGDKTKGTLTSPPILVQRRYLSFLVGGGGHQDRTCVNLLHDGKVVRTRTGAHHPTERREKLEPAMWDLKDLLGQSVSIQIVDKASGSGQASDRASAKVTWYTLAGGSMSYWRLEFCAYSVRRNGFATAPRVERCSYLAL